MLQSDIPASISIAASGGAQRARLSFFTSNGAFSSEEILQLTGSQPANYISAMSHKISNVTNPTYAQDAATKAYVDAGTYDNDTPYLFLNGTRPMTGTLSATQISMTDLYLYRSVANSALQLRGGSMAKPGAYINLWGNESLTTPGGIYFYIPNMAGSAWHNPLYFTNSVTGSTDSPAGVWSVSQYWQSNPIYAAGPLYSSTITGISRDVDNSYINLYGGYSGGAAITLNGKTSSFEPGNLDFWVTNAAGNTAFMAKFVGATDTPYLDMNTRRIANVAAPTTAGDALPYNAYTTWTPTLVWSGGVAPTGSTTSVYRYSTIGKTVNFQFFYANTDAANAILTTFTLPVTPKNNGVNVPFSGIIQYGAAPTYANPLPMVYQGDGKVYFRYFATLTDNQACQIMVSGEYEIA